MGLREWCAEKVREGGTGGGLPVGKGIRATAS